MRCTGSYRMVKHWDDCFKQCTEDAKCKAFGYSIITVGFNANTCFLKSTAELCASPGYNSLTPIENYYIKIWMTSFPLDPSWRTMIKHSVDTSTLVGHKVYMLYSINPRSIEQYQGFLLRRQQFRTRNYTTSVVCEGMCFWKKNCKADFIWFVRTCKFCGSNSRNSVRKFEGNCSLNRN